MCYASRTRSRPRFGCKRGRDLVARLAPGRPELIGVEEAGIPALHAAAVEPHAFSSVRLVRTLDSWQRVFESTVPARQLESVVHGVLKVYDLPDLLPLAGHVSVADPVAVAGRR